MECLFVRIRVLMMTLLHYCNVNKVFNKVLPVQCECNIRTRIVLVLFKRIICIKNSHPRLTSHTAQRNRTIPLKRHSVDNFSGNSASECLIYSCFGTLSLGQQDFNITTITQKKHHTPVTKLEHFY